MNNQNQNIQEEVKKLYYLSDEQIKVITKNVINVMAKDLVPSKNPMVVVVGGQSGSGKTALIHYTEGVSNTREFIEIDNDYFRGFHPDINKIKKNHPDYYVTATDQLGLGITAEVIKYFTDKRYNIILHQTLKSNRVVDDAMTKFKEAGYIVGVRAFAVPYFESKMSQIERCEGQMETLGYCRHVAKVDHDTALAGLPRTIDYIESSGKYDFIQIFKRGEKISQPELVYSKFNPASKEQTLQALADCNPVQIPNTDKVLGFTSARAAVEKTRATEAMRCAKTLDDRIVKAETSPYNTPEMQLHINELKDCLNEYRQSKKKLANLADCRFNKFACKLVRPLIWNSRFPQANVNAEQDLLKI